MKSILSIVDQLNWGIVILICATLGLAPFAPPHIIEKLSMLIRGNLIKPLDWFDLLLHGFPWVLLILKITACVIKEK
ncbi:MAG: RND transporter [Deltaproteobacteria bacterium]|nr:RND transporter [Deltaproteobacteria bacterium]